MPSENLRGSLFMVLAMADFAIEDMFIKAAATVIPTGIVLSLFGLGGMLAFMLMAKHQGEAIFHPAAISKRMGMRAFFEIIGRLFFVLAITLTPLSSASTILQATPLVVVLGAALFMGERVSMDRWLAIGIGFVGVLVVIRPGVDNFEPLSLLAVIAMLGFAGRDLATRAAPPVLSNRQLGIYGFMVLIPSGLAIQWYAPQAIQYDVLSSIQLLAAVAFGVAAYYWLTIAMRTGQVAAVTPFRYTRLLFAIALGMLVFNEQPDTMTLLGGLIIVASGIYILMQNRPTITN